MLPSVILRKQQACAKNIGLINLSRLVTKLVFWELVVQLMPPFIKAVLYLSTFSNEDKKQMTKRNDGIH